MRHEAVGGEAGIKRSSVMIVTTAAEIMACKV